VSPEPNAWRVERDGARTTFSFRNASLARIVGWTLFAAILPVGALAITAVVISLGTLRESPWVVVMDVVALAIVLAVARLYNRTRIVAVRGYVDWQYGPLFGARHHMTNAEAATISASVVKRARGDTARFDFVAPSGARMKLGGALDQSAHARFVIDAIQREIRERAPEITIDAGAITTVVNTKPPGWRETRIDKRTVFRFRSVPMWRAIFLTVLFAPLVVVAFSMTLASIREANWGAGYFCVGGFDLLAVFVVFFLVQQHDRTRITIDAGHVEWIEGPFFGTKNRLSFEEATTVNVTVHYVKRSSYLRFTFLRGENEVRLGTMLDDASAAHWVLERLDAELTKREPGIRTRTSTVGFPLLG
jgi:hypothetical protein